MSGAVRVGGHRRPEGYVAQADHEDQAQDAGEYLQDGLRHIPVAGDWSLQVGCIGVEKRVGVWVGSFPGYLLVSSLMRVCNSLM